MSEFAEGNNSGMDIDRERQELWDGLQREPMQISSKWFYDALGSALFDAITLLPEYYPTSCELDLLRDASLDFWAALPVNAAVVELGSGTADKILALMERVRSPRSYHPVDLSRAALKASMDRVQAAYPELQTRALHGNFCDAQSLGGLLAPIREQGAAIVFFPGGTIGNFEPEYARGLLRGAAQGCAPGSVMLLAVDRIKAAAEVQPAYDDSVGVTAAFNRNALAHLNRSLGTTFRPEAWEHRALYCAEHHRIEMWLHCKQAQRIELPQGILEFALGDKLRTECSYKYDEATLERLLAGSGWRLARLTADRSGRFCHALLELQSAS